MSEFRNYVANQIELLKNNKNKDISNELAFILKKSLKNGQNFSMINFALKNNATILPVDMFVDEEQNLIKKPSSFLNKAIYGTTKWSEIGNTTITQLQKIILKSDGFGIVNGSESGIVTIDIDDEISNEELQYIADKYFLHGFFYQKTNNGKVHIFVKYDKFFKNNSVKTYKFDLKHKEIYFDIRSNKGFTAVSGLSREVKNDISKSKVQNSDKLSELFDNKYYNDLSFMPNSHLIEKAKSKNENILNGLIKKIFNSLDLKYSRVNVELISKENETVNKNKEYKKATKTNEKKNTSNKKHGISYSDKIDAAFLKLVKTNHISNEKYNKKTHNRNNIMFSIAAKLRLNKVNELETFKIITDLNSNVNQSLPQYELENIVNQVFSKNDGEFYGVTNENLDMVWDAFNQKRKQGLSGFVRKDRKSRAKTHESEITKDFVTVLKQNSDKLKSKDENKNGAIQGSDLLDNINEVREANCNKEYVSAGFLSKNMKFLSRIADFDELELFYYINNKIELNKDYEKELQYIYSKIEIVLNSKYGKNFVTFLKQEFKKISENKTHELPLRNNNIILKNDFYNFIRNHEQWFRFSDFNDVLFLIEYQIKTKKGHHGGYLFEENSSTSKIKRKIEHHKKQTILHIKRLNEELSSTDNDIDYPENDLEQKEIKLEKINDWNIEHVPRNLNHVQLVTART